VSTTRRRDYHHGPVPYPVRPHVADAIDAACRRLGILASRLLELLVERHAEQIQREEAQAFVRQREPYRAAATTIFRHRTL
jgi:hypothetical protein